MDSQFVDGSEFRVNVVEGLIASFVLCVGLLSLTWENDFLFEFYL